MSKINLLPWREAERKEKRQEFLGLLGLFVIIAAAVIGVWHFYNNSEIDYQKGRNRLIEQETAQLDEKIREIQNLEKEKQRLLDRMRAIEQLQSNRPLIVRFFDELVQSLPEGVSVTSIAQDGEKVTINGEAQSNARVSSFMRNLETSKWLTNPELDIIQARNASGLRISSFTLRFQQVVPKAEGDDDV